MRQDKIGRDNVETDSADSYILIAATATTAEMSIPSNPVN